jgi:hypothetical protein
MLLGKIHGPQRTGPEKSYLRNGSPVFITWVKSRTLGTVECRDRLKPSEGRGLRVMWTYRIGQDLFSTSRSCRGNHRRRRGEEGDCSPAGVAMESEGEEERGRVKWKVPDSHTVAAHWPNTLKEIISRVRTMLSTFRARIFIEEFSVPGPFGPLRRGWVFVLLSQGVIYIELPAPGHG